MSLFTVEERERVRDRVLELAGSDERVVAGVSLERGRLLLAEYWTSAARDHAIALALACLRRGLPTSHGRGFDELPLEVLGRFEGALPRSLERAEFLSALAAAVDGLVREAGELGAAIEPQLRSIAAAR